MLQLAACIGNQFDLKTLSTVSQQSPATVARELWLPLKVGLLVPLNTAYKFTHVLDELERELVDSIDLKLEYKFLHDRVAQSAYSLIPASREKEIHLNVGRLLLKNTPPSDLEDKLFEIVNLLNIGSELVDDPQECDRLIELNLMAGRKAKASNAYEAAISYLATGIDLLSPNSWDTQYSLALDLYVERVEAEFLNTNFSQAETLADLVLDRAKTLLDKVKVYELKIPFYISQNKMQQAVDTALSVLKLLGISLPQKPNSLQLGVGLIRTKLTIGRKSPSDLENLPEMTDPYKLAAMRISVSAIPAIYMTNPELLPLIIFTMVNLCVKYGNSSLASYAYCMYGLALCGPLGDIEAGYPFGQLALRLVEKFEAKELKAKVYTVFNIFVRHWKEYLGETPPALLEAIQSGFETGDLEYTGHFSAFYCLHHFFMGKPLELVEEKLRYYSELMTKFKQDFIVVYLTMYQQLVVNLQEESEDPCKLTGEYFDETASMPILIQTGNRSACLFFYVAKIIVLYLLGDFAGAVENSRKATPYQDAVAGLTLSAEYNFYSSLSLLAQYPHVSQLEQKQFLKKVNANQKQMKKWMHHAPANHQYKYELVEAEKARVLG
ncbi:ATP-binding protein [Phormidium sp. CCY1219]|uniref:ATP-binding protein n=1 Tax=Phormidium sp. CCY1219 TaxID=2886104 RepID=UPI002D1F86FA|nr:hypothetical protein [Phormidium sp. CCY1219]MEB3826806.1 hypothetical protein [Phormidium sp. CCY1219]